MKVIKPNEFSAVDGSFTRASTATYVDGGILKTAAVNEPRFQDGVLLIEKEATNLTVYSEGLTDAVWIKNNTTVSTVTNIGLTTSVFKLTEQATNSVHGLYGGSASVVNGQEYTASVFIKAAERTSFRLVSYTGAQDIVSIFELNGPIVVYSNSHKTPTITSIGSGWYRVSHQFYGQATGGSIYRCQVYLRNESSLDTYLGDTSKGIYLTGLQVENGPAATSYIPTTTTAVYRAQDEVLSLTRATTATYVDSSGVLKYAAVNEQRFLPNGSLLIEKEATNLLLRSQTLNNATWSKSGCTIDDNALLGPDGSGNGCHIIVTGTDPYFWQTVSVISGVTYTFSVWTKAYTTAIGKTCNFLVWYNGTAIGTNTVQPFIATSGWTRNSFTFTAQGTGTVNIRLDMPDVGIVGEWLGVFGAQLEVGSIATSYIPTVAATVTRAADILNTGLSYTNATLAYAAWNSGTTYTLGAKVNYLGHDYESLQNSNTNQNPSTAATYWLDLGADNRHAALDTKIGTVTSATGVVSLIATSNKIDGLALLNLNASIVGIAIYDQLTLSPVYSNSFGTSGIAVNDWYEFFFFDPLSKRSQVVLSGLGGLYPNTIIGLQLKGSSTDLVSIGSILAGETEQLGATQYAPKVGIVDYSKKEADDFGNVSVIERPFSKRLSADIYFSNYDLNRIQRFLYSIRAKPVVWIASEDPTYEEALVVYGFYKDFSTTIAYPSHSLCNLEIEGLT